MGDTLGGSYMAVKPLFWEKTAEQPATTLVANCDELRVVCGRVVRRL